MRRCRSWRYHNVEGHTGHLPGGKCRRCWSPCRNRIPGDEWADGVRRCEDCVEALLHCPEVAVRRALVEEPGQRDDVLRALLTDPNGPVALAAERELFGRDNAVVLPEIKVPEETLTGRRRSVW